VLSSCLDWLARAALGPAAADQPTPRWGWGPAGPPAAPAADAADAAPPPDLPAAGQPVSFARHIKPLFRPRDRQSMSFAFDLWSHADVSAHAAGILRRLRDGSMPCDGAWSGDRIEVFARWADTGRQP
jgi:hypothetical protein